MRGARMAGSLAAGNSTFVSTFKPATLFLYELYDDRAAFDAHLASTHFKAFASTTQAMIARRSIMTWQRIFP